MRQLHLVRHAPVVVDVNRAPGEWDLAPNAAASIHHMLLGVDHSRLRRVVSSRQEKALKTARVISRRLDLPCQLRDGLEEHHRLKEDHIAGDAAFRGKMVEFFSRPDELVFGQESADAALKRFECAIHQLVGESEDDEMVVTHGTVMSLFLASGGNGSPMDLWSALASPDHIAVQWPNKSVA